LHRATLDRRCSTDRRPNPSIFETGGGLRGMGFMNRNNLLSSAA
jgi:hypothetical protein